MRSYIFCCYYYLTRWWCPPCTVVENHLKCRTWILAFFNELLSTQNVNVARFARNVEWDFFCDFQTPCPWWLLILFKHQGYWWLFCRFFVASKNSYDWVGSREIPWNSRKSHFPTILGNSKNFHFRNFPGNSGNSGNFSWIPVPGKWDFAGN